MTPVSHLLVLFLSYLYVARRLLAFQTLHHQFPVVFRSLMKEQLLLRLQQIESGALRGFEILVHLATKLQQNRMNL